MRVLFVSPHSDDVCLSVGAVAEHVDGVKHLLTVFSQSMWVEPEWDGPREPEEVTAARIREDAAFCLAHGFEYRALHLPDSSIRHRMRGNLRSESGHECRLRISAQAGLGKLAADESYDAIVGPLGLGHSDHVVCGEAVRRVSATIGVPALFYEDLPYAYEMSLRAIAVRAWRADRRLRPLLCRTGVSLDDKLKAALTYESQRKQAILDSVGLHSRRLYSNGASPSDSGGAEEVIERLWTGVAREEVLRLFDTSLDVEPPASMLVSLAVG